MKDRPDTTASTRGVTPATNPMNLTCTTKSATQAAPDAAPSMVRIIIHRSGQVPPPGGGWLPFVEPDANITYEFLDENTDPPTPFHINGAGVAIYYKE